MSKLWIDDDDWSGTRTPPSNDWLWAKTSAEALDYLQNPEITIDEVSFDHDLGYLKDENGEVALDEYTQKPLDDTTRRVVLWMAEFDAFPPICRIHTANNIGRAWLSDMITHYGPGVTTSPYSTSD